MVINLSNDYRSRNRESTTTTTVNIFFLLFFLFDYVFVSWTLLVEGGSSLMVGMMGGGCIMLCNRILHYNYTLDKILLHAQWEAQIHVQGGTGSYHHTPCSGYSGFELLLVLPSRHLFLRKVSNSIGVFFYLSQTVKQRNYFLV